MDLQLGLAVSRTSKGFDLNFSEIDSKDQQCNLKKRRFDEEEEEEDAAFEEKIDDNMSDHTLPLLLWNDNSSDMLINKDANGLVGWPPINPWRKRICHQNNSLNINCVAVENGGNGRGISAENRGRNSLFVKVKMEGFGIARKIDLSLHYSHDSLLKTLISMFGKCQESFHSYLLIFQDKEGDWKIVDDVPWREFMGSVQRLKLERKKV
ncbi:hypothetical protein M9H77_02138 [Catharanthus roseus]|uniref:Uncharacterized protein n=1 Tax=Catharanthus roseus TaxID=4058 RepID=A0ACC0C7J9_CATRO|nr:hypothetical protein M9H77_02138 [Catharanthus roseus]